MIVQKRILNATARPDLYTTIVQTYKVIYLWLIILCIPRAAGIRHSSTIVYIYIYAVINNSATPPVNGVTARPRPFLRRPHSLPGRASWKYIIIYTYYNMYIIRVHNIISMTAAAIRFPERNLTTCASRCI